MVFQPFGAEDKDIFDKYFKETDSRHCDMSFASVYLWKGYYPCTYTIYDNMLIFKGEGEQVSFSFPIGAGDPAKAVEAILEFCEENKIQPAFHCLTRDHEIFLEEKYPGRFQFEFDRDEAEYVYECEKLIGLRGKKYHGKKNHVNKFKKSFQWAYEEISDENREECIAMLADWKDDNEDPGDDEKLAEVCACKRALMEQESLGLLGGLIRADGRVVAFTLAEKINSDTIVIHFEKAYSDVPGAYSIINQEFLIRNAQDIPYVNREEDRGDLGLRKAKESYHPIFLLENGYAYEK
ncbi:MAG: phosphatidylglycerol lysyltransferase domain-containing protein [Eubacteriales bacterium]|nr:phosphatidylglycerol lysyltransferase domain-containing protein [Eubacteriales bacterium]